MVESNLEEQKRLIRKEILKKRDQLGEAIRHKGSILLTERILGHQWYYQSDILLGFSSFGSEISTREILQDALAVGKRVYLPRVLGKEMSFFRVRDLDELVPGYQGILEPDPSEELYSYAEEEAAQTFLLMPGVAFDAYRHRIGYGGGYYDRFLQNKEALRLRSVAVGFRCQMLEMELPVGERDMSPYQIICV